METRRKTRRETKMGEKGKIRRRYGEKIFATFIAVVTIILVGGSAVMAYEQSKEGVTMYYYLTQTGNSWKAETCCYEDMSSMVSLFVYKSNGGDLIDSNVVKDHTRDSLLGSSATRTYATITFTKSTINYGRSVHALLLPDTNVPYISGLELTKTK